jgi:hypothetical protein
MYYRGTRARAPRLKTAQRAQRRIFSLCDPCCGAAPHVRGFTGAAAAIIVYDITNSDSFARAKSWVRPPRAWW